MKRLGFALLGLAALLVGCAKEPTGDAQMEKYNENKAGADQLAKEKGEAPPSGGGQAAENN
ncbi:MAG: hypothetical protein U0S12_11380 [Fimbriimonadales bacterium]